jgi:hypothetical protein
VDALYTISLLVSLAAGSVSLVLGLYALFTLGGAPSKGSAHPSAPKAFRSVRIATDLFALGGVSGLTSLLVHWFWGHGKNTVAPMTVNELIRAHPSFLVAGLLVAAGAILVLAARARIASRAHPGNAA